MESQPLDLQSLNLPPIIKEFDKETEAKIEEFRSYPEAQEYLQTKHDKFFIARYLRARKYNVNEAVKMFVNTMKWREETNVTKIMQSFPNNPHYERLVSYWPHSHHWEDPPKSVDGSIVLMQALGRTDPAIIDEVGKDAILKFHIWCMETLENMYWKTVAEKGYWPGFIMIDDLAGVGFHSFSAKNINLAQEIVRVNQNYYPEMLRKMYILNVPTAFYFFWNGFQRWMEPRSIAKMELINGDASVLKDKFSIIFDLSKLPVRLGGTSTRDISMAGPVSTDNVTFKEEVKNIIEIGHGCNYEVRHKVSEGDVFSWEFKTVSNDIGFTVLYVDNDSNTQVIVPMERVPSDKRVIKGTVLVDKSGEYIFQWDNTFSWTRGKSLKYNLYKNDTLL